MSDRIVFEDVSKFYGEILGVNRVNLSIPPGITSLVGPNGSGKTTLMNLMTGLVKPTRGRIEILGYRTDDSENLFFTYGKGNVLDGNQMSVPLDEVLNRDRWRRAHDASPPSRLRSASVYASSAARPRVVRATVVVDPAPSPVFSLVR